MGCFPLIWLPLLGNNWIPCSSEKDILLSRYYLLVFGWRHLWFQRFFCFYTHVPTNRSVGEVAQRDAFLDENRGKPLKWCFDMPLESTFLYWDAKPRKDFTKGSKPGRNLVCVCNLQIADRRTKVGNPGRHISICTRWLRKNNQGRNVIIFSISFLFNFECHDTYRIEGW